MSFLLWRLFYCLYFVVSEICCIFAAERLRCGQVKVMNYFLTILFAVVALPCCAVEDSKCPVVKLAIERLPDLNVPRAGHQTFYINNEMVVVGGHTSGFVPTPTAEYFRDGQWHLMETVYKHDQGFAIPMKSGKVMIAGGHELDLGIGHIFSVELYDPINHHFEGYGCLDKKRSWAECLELDSGKVIITGNWYESDRLEQYNGNILFDSVKEVSQARTLPYLFRTAKDNAIIMGGIDEYDHRLDTIVIDRLHGKPFTLPFFDTWHPAAFLAYKMEHRAIDSFIGDEEKGIYAYLMAVEDSTGQMAIAKVEGEQISLLNTQSEVPMKSQWGDISYFTTVIIDRKVGRGYMVGHDDGGRLYVLFIDYTKEPAPLTLYYSEPQEYIGYHTPVLTAEGNLMMAGGITNNNFKPYASALLLCVRTPAASSASPWLWVVSGLAVLLVAAASFLLWRSRRRPTPTVAEVANEEKSEEPLFPEICKLMEEQKVYLNSNLKVGDVAVELDVPSRMVSDSIKANRGCSFAQFINGYRIEYAKQLLRNRPDAKMTAVYVESGFSNEMSFFRTFKAFTGMTPKEWMAQKD